MIMPSLFLRIYMGSTPNPAIEEKCGRQKKKGLAVSIEKSWSFNRAHSLPSFSQRKQAPELYQKNVNLKMRILSPMDFTFGRRLPLSINCPPSLQLRTLFSFPAARQEWVEIDLERGEKAASSKLYFELIELNDFQYYHRFGLKATQPELAIIRHFLCFSGISSLSSDKDDMEAFRPGETLSSQ